MEPNYHILYPLNILLVHPSYNIFGLQEINNQILNTKIAIDFCFYLLYMLISRNKKKLIDIAFNRKTLENSRKCLSENI